MIERVPQEVHVAALPGRTGQDLANGLPKTFVIVGDDELDAEQAALLERQEKIAPARAALPIGEIDAQDLPLPVAVDRHRDQHRLAEDHPGLAHILVAHIENEI